MCLKWNTSNNFCSSNTIFPSFYTSQASTGQFLCFKIFIMASHQSVVNINIIIKFPIGHKAFVSLCTTLPYTVYEIARYDTPSPALVGATLFRGFSGVRHRSLGGTLRLHRGLYTDLVLVTEQLLPERVSGLQLTGAPMYLCTAAVQN